MIKLTKGPKPEVLERNRENWTRELLAAIQARDIEETRRLTKRYNNPAIKHALKAETFDKCAYCEAKVTDVAHGDIEHVTPKSLSPERTYEWENLTFACEICNQNKSNKEGIIDPYADEPDNHLFFAGAFVKGRSEEGALSVLELKLNRMALIESRNREIQRYADLLEKIFLSRDARLKELILDSIEDELESRRPEFIAACRFVLETYRSQPLTRTGT